MQNIACVARGEREGVIPRKRPRVSGGNLSPRARKRAFLRVSEAKRAASYSKARGDSMDAYGKPYAIASRNTDNPDEQHGTLSTRILPFTIKFLRTT